jgi:hypothetical protein
VSVLVYVQCIFFDIFIQNVVSQFIIVVCFDISDLCQIIMPPESLPLFIPGFFTEGTNISV